MAPTQLIRKVLSPAVRLWLRSQVESVEVLSFEVGGTDRQLLSGEIPKISILGEQVIYQGLHLSHLDIVGQGIKTNLPQVLRGKAFQLLEPIFVQATLRMIDRDMNQCLQAPLLANAVSEVLDQWLGPLGEANVGAAPEEADRNKNPQAQGNTADPAHATATHPPHWREVRMQFQPDRLTLWATLARSTQADLAVTMGAIVRLQDPHTIVLDQLSWDTTDPAATAALASLDHLTLNLGKDVDFKTLALTEGQVLCEGKILIRP